MAGRTATQGRQPDAGRIGQLRQDVRLVPGPHEPAGAPTWQLVDPLRHQYFRLGWLEFECLSRWRLGDAARIAAAVRADTTLLATADDVLALNRFLHAQQLLQVREPPRAPPVPAWQRHYMKLVYHRFPLLHPQPLLDRLVPLTDWLWRRGTGAILGVLAALALWALGARAGEVMADLGRYANQQGLLLGLAVLAVTKTLHEFGHGIACRRHGCRVPAMGVAFVFLWPMPYVDTSDTWRLLDRRKRLEVALAGVATEVLLAIIASFAWLYLPPGLPRDVCLFVAVLSWTLSILVNLNPLMRFDGYYALVDATGMDNLQTRAFAQLRWQLLQWLGHTPEPPPELASGRGTRWLFGYGAASAAYRLSIYVAVTALVVTQLPEAVAVPLLLAGWYLLVLRPLARDAGTLWTSPRHALRGLWHILRAGGWKGWTLGLLLLLVAWFALPLPRVLTVPAVQGAKHSHALHVAEPALWTGWQVAHGAQVRSGQLLATLRNPELDTDIARQQLTLATLEQRFATRGSAARDGVGQGSAGDSVSAEEVRSARGTLEALLARRERLSLRAPAAGRVYFDEQDLARPRWLAADTRLGTLVGGGGVVQAFLDPTQRQQLDLDAGAMFYAGDCSLACAPIAVRVLQQDELASRLSIAPRLAGFASAGRASAGPAGAERHDVYRLLLSTGAAPAGRERFGHLRLRTRPVSPLFDALRRGLGVVRREAGV
jgi:putative peptide zinc metalloprotease protein